MVHVAPRHLSEPQTADPSLSRLDVAADPKAFGAVRNNRVLKEPNYRNWGRIAYPPTNWQHQSAEG
ncbi:MAG: hypothetical protein KME20_16375 [Kaiparowitsia implicata GSE-PSE-MK54-09C]|nr:hypothetical protein [Kaiparowitsia implicata GSE-PSE-MK54-09C]